jgi:hypothetical protein
MRRAIVAVFAITFAAGMTSVASAEYHQCRDEKPKKYCEGKKADCEKKGCAVIQTIVKPADLTPAKVFKP